MDLVWVLRDGPQGGAFARRVSPSFKLLLLAASFSGGMLFGELLRAAML